MVEYQRLSAKAPNFAPAESPGAPYLCDTGSDDDLTEYQCVAKIMSGYHNKNNNAIRSQNNFWHTIVS